MRRYGDSRVSVKRKRYLSPIKSNARLSIPTAFQGGKMKMSQVKGYEVKVKIPNGKTCFDGRRKKGNRFCLFRDSEGSCNLHRNILQPYDKCPECLAHCEKVKTK